ncbi:phosphate ABC transporter, permease protein PstA, partial [Mammaliicoccus fleurettii]
MTETNKNVRVDQQTVEKKLSGRLTTNKVNKWAFFACTMVGLLVLAALLIDTLIK